MSSPSRGHGLCNLFVRWISFNTGISFHTGISIYLYYNISKKSVGRSVGRSVRLFVRLFVCLSVTFFTSKKLVALSLCLSICLSVCPSRFLPYKKNDLTGYLKAKMNIYMHSRRKRSIIYDYTFRKGKRF